MKFKKLAEVFSKLEQTSSNLAMIDILADFFSKITPEEAKISAYLIRGEIAPPFANLNLGLAEKMVERAIAKTVNINKEEIKKMFSKIGDLGEVAKNLLENNKGKGLTIKEVFEKLNDIAMVSGQGSQDIKINILSELLRDSSGDEAKYIIRLVLGALRLGVGEMTFLYGISKALTGAKEKKKILEHAFNVCSDLGEVAYQAKKNGIDALEDFKPEIGIPVRMMLAQRIKDLEEVKTHIPGEFFVEYKYDGERIQAHIKNKNEIVLFSRRHENITNQFPDVVNSIKSSFQGNNGIIEGEVVAIDKKTQQLQEFQVLMQRRRKYDVDQYVEKIPVKYFLFDILEKDEESLINFSLKKRREILERSILKNNEEISLAKYIITQEIGDLEDFFFEAVKDGAEGVVIKNAQSIYQAGTRGWNWIKYKKDYKKELTDTFDLVVVGGIYGNGRRGGSYGSLLAAAYDPESNKYYSFTKVGAGFSDKDLAMLPRFLNKYKIKEKHRLVETDMQVDVWFEPVVVMEVSGADITISPVHTVARDKVKRGGLALRFPRFIRWRNDKTAEEATTVKEIYQIYRQQ